jgi:urate oxidase
MSVLSSATYGKDKVRVFRVVRDEKWHKVVEYNVTVLLQGDLDARYDLDIAPGMANGNEIG